MKISRTFAAARVVLPATGVPAVLASIALALVVLSSAASAAGRPSVHTAKRPALHGASSARGHSASRYPSAKSGPRNHGGSAPRAVAAAAKKTPKKPSKPKLTGNPARALLAFEAMQRYYYVRGSGLYAGEPFSYLWPFSQALAATVSMANVPKLPVSLSGELHARLIGLRTYLDLNNSGAPEGIYTSSLAAFDGTVAPPVGPGGAKYYDDNDWIGIELARHYEKSRNAGALGYAQGIMAFEIAGYSTDPSLACPGGIPFSNAIENTDRNTITTAPAAELAVQSCTKSRATCSTCSSPKRLTTGCARACCERTTCMPTTFARTAWSTAPSGATTRA